MLNKRCLSQKIQIYTSIVFYGYLFSTVSSNPINRQAGISDNVFITVENDTFGIEQRVCSIESLTYEDGESLPTSSPCEHCICRPPGFACTIISCEYRPGCKALKRSDQCCPEYQCECEKEGRIFQNGEKILDDNNPCEVCYCQGGEVICAVIDCYWRSDCQPRYIENRCCPLYDHCPSPSEHGQSRPTQRPTMSTTTLNTPISWFNMSSAIYATPSTTRKPLLPSSTPAPTVTSTTEIELSNLPETDSLRPSNSEEESNNISVQEGSHNKNSPEVETSPIHVPENQSSINLETSESVSEDTLRPVSLVPVETVSKTVSTQPSILDTIDVSHKVQEIKPQLPESSQDVHSEIPHTTQNPTSTSIFVSEDVQEENKLTQSTPEAIELPQQLSTTTDIPLDVAVSPHIQQTESKIPEVQIENMNGDSNPELTSQGILNSSSILQEVNVESPEVKPIKENGDTVLSSVTDSLPTTIVTTQPSILMVLNEEVISSEGPSSVDVKHESVSTTSIETTTPDLISETDDTTEPLDPSVGHEPIVLPAPIPEGVPGIKNLTESAEDSLGSTQTPIPADNEFIILPGDSLQGITSNTIQNSDSVVIEAEHTSNNDALSEPLTHVLSSTPPAEKTTTSSKDVPSTDSPDIDAILDELTNSFPEESPKTTENLENPPTTSDPQETIRPELTEVIKVMAKPSQHMEPPVHEFGENQEATRPDNIATEDVNASLLLSQETPLSIEDNFQTKPTTPLPVTEISEGNDTVVIEEDINDPSPSAGDNHDKIPVIILDLDTGLTETPGTFDGIGSYSQVNHPTPSPLLQDDVTTLTPEVIDTTPAKVEYEIEEKSPITGEEDASVEKIELEDVTTTETSPEPSLFNDNVNTGHNVEPINADAEEILPQAPLEENQEVSNHQDSTQNDHTKEENSSTQPPDMVTTQEPVTLESVTTITNSVNPEPLIVVEAIPEAAVFDEKVDDFQIQTDTPTTTLKTVEDSNNIPVNTSTVHVESHEVDQNPIPNDHEFQPKVTTAQPDIEGSNSEEHDETVRTTLVPLDTKFRLDLSNFDENEQTPGIETTEPDTAATENGLIFDNVNSEFHQQTVIESGNVPTPTNIVHIPANDETFSDIINEKEYGSLSGEIETTPLPPLQRHHLLDHEGELTEKFLEDITTDYPTSSNQEIGNNEMNATSMIPVVNNTESSIVAEKEAPKFQIPSELVKKVEPISDDLETGYSRSDLTHDADNEVTNADSTWYWRTFDRIRSLFPTPPSRSSRRPRSTVSDFEIYSKYLSFPRFLFW